MCHTFTDGVPCEGPGDWTKDSGDYPELFSNPIKGIVEDKAFLASDDDKATYPRFKSYDNYISIPEIYDNVDYIGGFEMHGSSIMGASDGTNLAKLYIKKKNVVLNFWLTKIGNL